MINKNDMIFTIIALGHLGDTILVEPMCKNIKKRFPNSKIIFITNKLFEEIALGFESVDEIYGYDKSNSHKGITGYVKFASKFPYRNETDYAIITHPHERSVFTAKAIGAENIISLPVKRSLLNLFINKKRKYDITELRNTFKGDFNTKYLSGLCLYEFLPVSYIRKDINYDAIKDKFKLPKQYMVLSPTSKDKVKDWDYKNIKEFIINNHYNTVLVGTEKANIIAKQLKSDGINFIDITNRTTITELGAVIKMSDTCISVDTGTFHLSYAQDVKTIGLFFNEGMVKEWVPHNYKNITIIKGKKYKYKNNIICEKDIKAQDVLKEIETLNKENNKCLLYL